jgi:hypothetical protein
VKIPPLLLLLNFYFCASKFINDNGFQQRCFSSGFSSGFFNHILPGGFAAEELYHPFVQHFLLRLGSTRLCVCGTWLDDRQLLCGSGYATLATIAVEKFAARLVGGY